ncbi:MAG: phosphatidylglycerol lysyltransferase domain-containing protein [Oscillospiraceae bacterium]|jgi:hypothetical protein|nr:phosphatidylglycerol lysyltransferase domain-containing protein [Oscillospiraceae bacterium]
MEFQKLELQDIDIIRPFFEMHTNRMCDNTAGVVVMWRDSFHTHYAIEDGTLFLRFSYGKQKEIAYSMPIGLDKKRALETLKAYLAQTKQPVMICAIAKEDLELVGEVFGELRVRAERQWFDYLYEAEDLATFKGRKFNGQRNHINRFKKMFPAYRLVDIDTVNVRRVQTFLKDYMKNNLKENPTAKEEARNALEVLEHFEIYQLFGAFIEVDGEIIAFSVGEKVNDTLFVHIEKALTDYHGSYQIMVNEFAKRFVSPKILYINREDDVGDEGLRQSKLSYHPVQLIEKHLAKPKNQEDERGEDS